tara:strand:+ start:3844 stop:4410 length:567 start_codon:yes stop_codon:yes gene_type:complete
MSFKGIRVDDVKISNGSNKNMILNNAVIELIQDRFEEGSVILEFGSGEGSTQKLSPFYKMISIEEDDQRVMSDMFDSTGYHAPVREDNNWYDVDVVKKAFEFANETYGKIDLIIVDGPAKGKRAGLFEIIDNGVIIIDEDTEIIFDDCNRGDDCDTANAISKKLGRKLFAGPDSTLVMTTEKRGKLND